MDHLTFAQLLGSYGEFLGAIAVVATLVYLAVQLRQNTRALRSSTFASYVSASFAVNDFRAEHAEVMAKVDRHEALDHEETIIFMSFLYKLFGTWEEVFLHYKEGVLSEEIFEARMAGMEVAFATLHNISKHWHSMKSTAYTASFVQYVDRRLLG